MAIGNKSVISYSVGKAVSWNKNVMIIYALSIVTICKGQTGTLNCSTGSDTIDILDADFGRYDLTTCGNSSTNPHCGTATAWNFIVDKCQSRKTCSIIHDESTDKLLGTPDPCPGVIKYIQVVYQCTGINLVMLNNLGVRCFKITLLHKCFLDKKYLILQYA